MGGQVDAPSPIVTSPAISTSLLTTADAAIFAGIVKTVARVQSVSLHQSQTTANQLETAGRARSKASSLNFHYLLQCQNRPDGHANQPKELPNITQEKWPTWFRVTTSEKIMEIGAVGAAGACVAMRLVSVWRHRELLFSRGSEPYTNLRAARFLQSHGFGEYLSWHDVTGMQPYGRVRLEF